MTKKKLMMMAAVIVAAFGVWAATETVGGYTWTYQIDGDTAEIYKDRGDYTGTTAISPKPTGAVTIPSTLGGKPVTSIGLFAFWDCSGLTSVTIPDSVTSIGIGAFYNCSGLTSVSIPDSVTRIKDGAFRRCTSLVSVYLPIRFKNCLDSSVFEFSNPVFIYRRSPTDWCSVSFNPNGGRVSPYDGTVKYGDELGTFPAVKRDRYVFLGWYTQANGGRKISPPIKITSDCTFYAHWTNEPEFTITNGVLTAVELNYATDVVIPAGVKSIGAQAFSAYSVCFGLTDLKSVTIPNGVTNIASMAFDGCTGLTKVTIPDSVIDIGIGAFTYCDNLCFDTTTIPGVKLMDGWVIDSSWYNISGHLDLTGVRGIGGGAFSGSSKLSSVMIPGSVKSVCGAAFDSCSGLTSLTLGSGVTYIGAAAFANCSNLTTVRIPSSVTRLGRYAFRACSNLTSAILPTQIEWDETVFIGCPKVTIDRKNVFVSVHTVNFDANGGSVSASSRRVGSGAPIGELPTPTRSGYTFAGWWTSSSGGTQVLESTTIFGDIKLYAHWNVVSYTVRFNANGGNGGTTLTVASGAVLGELPTPTRNGYVFTGWFTDVRGGTQVSASTIVTENVQFYAHWWNGVDYTVIFDANGGDGGASRIVSGGSAVGTLPMPTRSGFTFTGWFTAESGGARVSELTEITDNVIFYAHWQYSVKDPESAAEFIIENGVLTAVKPNGETSVAIPDGVTSIGDGAFHNYRKDYKCDGLTSVKIPDSVTSVGMEAFYLCRGLATMTIPNSVTNIGVDAFRGCSGLASVTIGNGVTSIGRCAFLGCSGLASVTIGNGVTSIGDSAFLGCRGLVSVTIPDSVTSIEPSAFSGCSGLTSVTIPDSVKSIGYGAFRGCSGLTSLTIPDSVTSIGGSAFAGCESLTSVILPKRFEGNLSEYVFYGCPSNLKITYGGGSYKVTFGKNGGTGGDNYVTATYGAAMPTPRTAPKLSGWTFAGYWDTLAMDDNGNPKGKQYYDASMKSVRNWDKKAATTLWAKWTNKVTFGKNGGAGGDNYVTCTKGQPMPKRTMPTKSGYAFAGYWNTTGTGGVKYYNADGTSAHAWDRSGNVTLWAKWEKAVSVKVTFGKNGGMGGDNYVTCTTGKPMPTPRTAPKRTGWTFDGYWDTLAVDANGNPTGKQYYDKDMKSVRIWDKPTATTLWAKWTVKVTLGKNGGTGGDSFVIVTYNQPFPKATMPTRAGYTFGGYFVSSSKKTGQCYNANGTPTASMKWTTGGTPTVWALWTKTGSCVVLPAAAASAVADIVAIPAGLYSGVLADGSGSFLLMLDEPAEGFARTAYIYVASEDGVLEAECTVEEADGLLILTTEDGETFAADPAAGTGSRF